MTKQKSIQEIKPELILVSDLLTEIDKKIIANNRHLVYSLPIVDSMGKFQGYHRLDSKIDSSFKALKTDSFESHLLPVVTGG